MSKKILIADQSDSVREVAENLFRKKGFEVVSASDGVEALELLRTAGIDLAFLNSDLPEIDGYIVSQQAKSEGRTKDIKVVLLLSASEIVNQHQLSAAKADDTLNKPFTQQDLIEITSTALSIEIDYEREGEETSAEMETTEDLAEEIGIDKEQVEEIDFDSIFSDEEKSEVDRKLDAVFLADDDQAVASPHNDSETGGQTRESEPLAKPAGEPDEMIRLADDQYDLGSQPPESEIEMPHDYNWFVREMKKDLTTPKLKGAGAGAADKTASATNAPAGSGDDLAGSNVEGQFDVEEIGTSKVQATVARLSQDTVAEFQDGSDSLSGTAPSPEELSLAEKLLVKELAKEMAARLVGRISSTELRQALVEALSSLKKM
jgi:CheY-like chemotaxis protein